MVTSPMRRNLAHGCNEFIRCNEIQFDMLEWETGFLKEDRWSEVTGTFTIMRMKGIFKREKHQSV